MSKSCHPDDIISLVKSSVDNLISTHPAEVHTVERRNFFETNDENDVLNKTEDIQIGNNI